MDKQRRGSGRSNVTTTMNMMMPGMEGAVIWKRGGEVHVEGTSASPP